MGADSFIVHVKTEDIYEDIAKGWKNVWFFKLLVGKTASKWKKKSHWLNERWINRKNNEKFVGLRTKT